MAKNFIFLPFGVFEIGMTQKQKILVRSMSFVIGPYCGLLKLSADWLKRKIATFKLELGLPSQKRKVEFKKD